MLEGWGWTWEQAVCLSQRWVPASLPGPTPAPQPSRVCLRKGQAGQGHVKKCQWPWAMGVPPSSCVLEDIAEPPPVSPRLFSSSPNPSILSSPLPPKC